MTSVDSELFTEQAPLAIDSDESSPVKTLDMAPLACVAVASTTKNGVVTSTENRAPDFTTHFHQTLPEVLRIGRRTSYGQAIAEEIAQETLMNVWRRWDKIVDPGDGSGRKRYTYQAAINTAINTVRREQKARKAGWVTVVNQDVISRMPDNGPLGTEEEALGCVPGGLRQFLELLPPTFADAIEAVDLRGKSYSEHAEESGIPIGTVMSRLHRGRKLLAGILLAETGLNAEEAKTQHGYARLLDRITSGPAE